MKVVCGVFLFVFRVLSLIYEKSLRVSPEKTSLQSRKRKIFANHSISILSTDLPKPSVSRIFLRVNYG